MNLSDRDRRALAFLGVALLLAGIIYFWPADAGAEIVSADPSTPEAAEARLRKLREVVATLPGKEQLRKGLETQLLQREKGMILADTAAQAQASLMQTVTRLARSQTPMIDIQQRDFGVIQPLGKEYGEVTVTVSFPCQIEQLVNLLADVASQPELIATHDLQVRAGDPKSKAVYVRMTVSGVTAKKLVPERKGAALF